MFHVSRSWILYLRMLAQHLAYKVFEWLWRALKIQITFAAILNEVNKRETKNCMHLNVRRHFVQRTKNEEPKTFHSRSLRTCGDFCGITFFPVAKLICNQVWKIWLSCEICIMLPINISQNGCFCANNYCSCPRTHNSSVNHFYDELVMVEKKTVFQILIMPWQKPFSKE